MKYPTCPKCGSELTSCFGPAGNKLAAAPHHWHSSRKRISRLKGETVDNALDRIAYEIEISKVHDKWIQKIEAMEESYREEVDAVCSYWVSVQANRAHWAKFGVHLKVGSR
jgi:hypothetical protein